jgi:hypothetical protein
MIQFPRLPFEAEREMKEETARLLRGLQPGEFLTEEDIFKHNPKIQRIILANNYMTSNIDGDQEDELAINADYEYEHDEKLDDNESDGHSEGNGILVWANPICPQICSKCPGYLVNHFTEETVSCLYRCHDRTKDRPTQYQQAPHTIPPPLFSEGEHGDGGLRLV